MLFKIKFVYLKLPNPIHEDVIGYIGELPLEFGLHRFVDYERQFDSAFLKNLAAMCEPLKWELEKRASFAEWGI